MPTHGRDCCHQHRRVSTGGNGQEQHDPRDIVKFERLQQRIRDLELTSFTEKMIQLLSWLYGTMTTSSHRHHRSSPLPRPMDPLHALGIRTEIFLNSWAPCNLMISLIGSKSWNASLIFEIFLKTSRAIFSKLLIGVWYYSQLAIAAAKMRGEYPERPGQPECQYYLKTGTCKFGATCRFHHPREMAGRVSLNVLGYPLRPISPPSTIYYMMAAYSGSPLYPTVQSPTSPGKHSYPGGITNWSMSRASFVPSPRWQAPSNYAQMILPQVVVSVLGWNAY
ncbi:hypothetical protein E3N88_22720 [Mikania micrantha]|uniref:C3H1-type domain-containing protein n=1 Tax=Mikania micrantha TaxID=192012 RepID=A0A5N6NCB6_9ASTR|nr:hypothetical protein E3N88_22720 [Mikania micrantha]